MDTSKKINSLKQIIEKTKRFIITNLNYVLPLLIFFIGFLLVNLLTQHFGDDVNFAAVIDNMPGGLTIDSLNSYLVSKFYTWSSRLPIEFLVIFLCRVPILFRILNTFIGCLVIFLIFKLVRSKSLLANSAIVVIFFTINQTLFSSAGLIATCLNFFWPVSFSLLAIYNASIYILDNKKPQIALIVLSVILLILYALWSESCAISLSIAFIAFTIFYYIKYKKINFYFILIAILSIGMMAYAFSVPGNAARTKAETATWYPEFANFSFFDKISLALIASYRDYMQPFNFFFVIFLMIFTILINKNKLLRTNAILMFINILLYNCIFNSLVIANSQYIGEFFTTNLSNPSFIGSIFACLFYIHTIIAVFFSVEDTKIKFSLLAVFVVGVCSKALMGFSPTVWASNYRTASLMVITTLVLSLFYLNNIIALLKDKKICKKKI